MAIVASETWTGTNGASWPAQWTVALGGDAAGSATIQGNKGRFATGGGTAYNGYINARLGSMPSQTTCEAYIEFTPNTAAGVESYLAIILRGSNDWFTWNKPTSGYGVRIENGGSKLVEWVGGTESDLTSFSSDGWAAAETWAVRFQCTGTTIRFRIWDTSGGEPGTWKGSVTDATHSAGVFQMCLENGGAGTDCQHDFDSLSISDLAPTPPTPDVLPSTWRILPALTGARGSEAEAVWTDFYFGAQPPTGTAAVSLAAATSTASGARGNSGSAAPTLSAATSSASGTHVPPITGTAAVSLAAATSSASATHVPPVSGSVATTLSAATASASGTRGNTGTAAPTLAAATSSASATHIAPITGTAAPTLSAATSTATGARGNSGSAATTLSAATSTATGARGNSGSAAVSLSPATAAASGTHIAPISGTVAATLAGAVVSASGTRGATGTAAVSLSAATTTASGAHGVAGTASPTLAAATASASGTFTGSSNTGTAAITLAPATSSASGTFIAPITGSASATLGPVVVEVVAAHGVAGSVVAVLDAATGSAIGIWGIAGESGKGSISLRRPTAVLGFRESSSSTVNRPGASVRRGGAGATVTIERPGT